MTSIDLNSDLGEGFGRWELGDDLAMLDIVTSANIACGFHAGDPHTIRTTVAAARDKSVVIGAHVGYNDLAGFGRRNMDVASHDLIADVIYQIGALEGLARSAGTVVRYVKPHGALYNTIVHDARQGADVVTAILEIDPSLIVMGLAGSAFIRRAQDAGLRTATEAFADRAYTPDGTLVPRSVPGAVLHDPSQIAERMVELVTRNTVTAIDGTVTAVTADSVCVHGDTSNAAGIARRVRDALVGAGVSIRSFAADG